MAKYRVTMMEKTYYELYVEADSKEEAEEKAEEAFDNGEGDVNDSYICDITVEEETK